MHNFSLNLIFANMVCSFTDSVKSSVNRDLGFGNAFVKPILSFI